MLAISKLCLQLNPESLIGSDLMRSAIDLNASRIPEHPALMCLSQRSDIAGESVIHEKISLPCSQQ